MTAGMLRLVPTDGRPPTVVASGPEDVPDALRLLGRLAGGESVRSGRRRVELVVGGGDAA